jgi:Rrf2 family iron-sulfur cluster assembly transcriptional regulator
MFTPSKKCVLAMEAVLFIACTQKKCPISSKDLSQQLGFPVRYLEQLMQKLVRDSILRGIRGPKGGYVLAKDRKHITLQDICDSLSLNAQGETEDCDLAFGSELGEKVIQPLVVHAVEASKQAMRSLTLDDLHQDAQSKEVDICTQDSDNNYTI